jgi:hypothetical protein
MEIEIFPHKIVVEARTEQLQLLVVGMRSEHWQPLDPGHSLARMLGASGVEPWHGRMSLLEDAAS